MARRLSRAEEREVFHDHPADNYKQFAYAADQENPTYFLTCFGCSTEFTLEKCEKFDCDPVNYKADIKGGKHDLTIHYFFGNTDAERSVEGLEGTVEIPSSAAQVYYLEMERKSSVNDMTISTKYCVDCFQRDQKERFDECAHLLKGKVFLIMCDGKVHRSTLDNYKPPRDVNENPKKSKKTGESDETAQSEDNDSVENADDGEANAEAVAGKSKSGKDEIEVDEGSSKSQSIEAKSAENIHSSEGSSENIPSIGEGSSENLQSSEGSTENIPNIEEGNSKSVEDGNRFKYKYSTDSGYKSVDEHHEVGEKESEC